jgi:hypothetical protein
MPERDVLPHKRPSYPAQCEVSSTPQLFDPITNASEYWIAHQNLSSGGHSADPLAGDDGWGYGAFVLCEVDGGQFAK